jgi:ribonuclease E
MSSMALNTQYWNTTQMIRILINATQKEELRVAVISGQNLINLSIENRHKTSLKANIYQGIIGKVENSLEACFVDYGAARHGFLPFREIAKTLSGCDDNGDPLPVNQQIKEGDRVIVQIDKEERGTKGAALTTDISLAGRFLVLKPLNPKSSGISRKINNTERKVLHETLNNVSVPNDMGVIIRTAGAERSAEELQWDLDYQIQIYHSILAACKEKKDPFLIYKESDVIIKTLRDNFHDNIGEILIDDKRIFDEAQSFVKKTMPNKSSKIKHYTDTISLFNRFQIEAQIETAFAREVNLPSGGEIVIDYTEAMTAIDINSARANKGSDIEDTAFTTNLEAADEIARQMRLRDLGGLLVIDFIDMSSNQHRSELQMRMRSAVKKDRARVQIGKISRFGLMEMSRQRLNPALSENSMQTCPRCMGVGNIRTVDSLSLTILRVIEEESLKENTQRIIATLPVNVATYILNEKRNSLDNIEKKAQIHLLVIPNPAFETPHYQIERVKDADTTHQSYNNKSFELDNIINEPYIPEQNNSNINDTAAIKNVKPKTKIPKSTRKVAKKPGFFAGLLGFLGLGVKRKTNRRKYNKNYKRHNYKTRSRYNRNNNKKNTNNKNNTTKKRVSNHRDN